MKTGNSYYGVKYKINGHRVGNVFALSSEYHVTFERCYSENTLESVEAIDWKNVTVEQIRTDCPACPLPEGYAFTVKAIQYDMNTQSIKVIIKADKQYWGDVTPYQAQIESLNATVTEQTAQIADKDAQLEELEEKDTQLAEKDSKIAAMADAETAAKILLGEAE